MQTSETLIMRRPMVALHDVDKHYMPHLGDIARAAALRHVKGRHALSELARMTAMRLIPSLRGHMAKSAEHAEQVPPMTIPVLVPANFHGMSTGKTVRFHLHRSSSDLRALKSPRLLSPHHPMKTVSMETMAAETVLTDTMPMEAVTTGAMVYDHVEASPITEGTPTLTATEVTAFTPTLMGVTMPDVLAEVSTPEALIPDASAQGWGNVLALSENPHPVATYVVEDGKPQPVDGNKDMLHRGTLSLGMSLLTHDQAQTQAQVQEEDDEKMAMMRALSSLNRMGEVQGHGIGAPRTSHGGRLTIAVPGRFLKGERMRQRDVMVESVPIVMKGQQPQAAQVKRHAPLVDMATQISDAERMIEVDHTAAVNVRSMLHKLRRTLSELEHRVQNALRPTRPHEA